MLVPIELELPIWLELTELVLVALCAGIDDCVALVLCVLRATPGAVCVALPTVERRVGGVLVVAPVVLPLGRVAVVLLPVLPGRLPEPLP